MLFTDNPHLPKFHFWGLCSFVFPFVSEMTESGHLLLSGTKRDKFSLLEYTKIVDNTMLMNEIYQYTERLVKSKTHAFLAMLQYLWTGSVYSYYIRSLEWLTKCIRYYNINTTTALPSIEKEYYSFAKIPASQYKIHYYCQSFCKKVHLSRLTLE